LSPMSVVAGQDLNLRPLDIVERVPTTTHQCGNKRIHTWWCGEHCLCHRRLQLSSAVWCGRNPDTKRTRVKSAAAEGADLPTIGGP
jgi:hypothetical protein